MALGTKILEADCGVRRLITVRQQPFLDYHQQFTVYDGDVPHEIAVLQSHSSVGTALRRNLPAELRGCFRCLGQPERTCDFQILPLAIHIRDGKVSVDTGA